MTAKEALEALASGKKIRKYYWKEGRYIMLGVEGCIINDAGGEEYVHDFVSFQIYKEPKKKTKMWLWAYSLENQHGYFVSDRYFESEKSFIESFYSYLPDEIIVNFRKRLDHTEIEVEE